MRHSGPERPLHDADLDWISDDSLLGADLSQALQNIYRNRRPGSSQFYVSLVPGAANPSFDHELAYAQRGTPTPAISSLLCSASGTSCSTSIPTATSCRTIRPVTDYWNEVLRSSIPRIGLSHRHHGLSAGADPVHRADSRSRTPTCGPPSRRGRPSARAICRSICDSSREARSCFATTPHRRAAIGPAAGRRDRLSWTVCGGRPGQSVEAALCRFERGGAAARHSRLPHARSVRSGGGSGFARRQCVSINSEPSIRSLSISAGPMATIFRATRSRNWRTTSRT